MIPRLKPFGIFFGLVTENQSVKFIPIKQGNQLTKQACMSYYRSILLVVGLSFISWLTIFYIQGGFFSTTFLTNYFQTVFGQV
jgi:hypothetical protein